MTWATSAYPFTLTIEDRTGLWWSAKLTAGNSAATLTVNDTTIEIPRSDSSHSFHLFVDGSVAELIVDRRHAVTTRIYRKPDGPLLLVNTALESCSGWHLRAISPDRLTT